MTAFIRTNRKRLGIRAIALLGIGALFLGGPLTASAADVDLLSGTYTFATLDASDGSGDGTYHVTGNFTMENGAVITCNDSPGPNACPIKIEVTGNMLMKAGAKILAENNAGGGNGGDISITVGGNLTLCGTTGTDAGCGGAGSPGAIISSSKTSGAGDTGHGGDITLTVTGNVVEEPGAKVTANSTGPAGNITITGNIISIDGSVLSQGLTTTVGRGGQITIDAACDLTVNGTVSSKGRDPGADRVHLEGGCIVKIFGLVESTGPGHQNPPKNHCSAPDRPDKPSNSTACVEVWAGDSLELNSVSPHKGEVNADTASSGGTQGLGWIDLFARGNITITGDTVAPYAGHANQTLGNGHGGVITVKSKEGKVETFGLALQANDTSAGGKGGQVTVEAGGAGSPGGDVNLHSASIQAKGATGSSSTAGGTILVQANGQILGIAPGELNAGGGGTPGSVTLKACGGVTYAGTATPAASTGVPAACPFAPAFQDYVKLPPCVCGCACLTVFDPIHGPAGTTVTITGKQLLFATGVVFSPNCEAASGTPATIVGTTTDTQIQVTVPVLSNGPYKIVISSSAGTCCSTNSFTVP
jgi:hypothetical protein